MNPHPPTDFYGRTGLSGRAGLSRLKNMLEAGQIKPADAARELAGMGRGPQIPTPPAPAAPAMSEPGQQGHGAMVAQLMAAMQAQQASMHARMQAPPPAPAINGQFAPTLPNNPFPPPVTEPPDPAYEMGRALGRMLGRRG